MISHRPAPGVGDTLRRPPTSPCEAASQGCGGPRSISPPDPAAADPATSDPTKGYQPLLDSEPMRTRRPEDHLADPPACGSVPCPSCPDAPPRAAPCVRAAPRSTRGGA